MSPALHSHVRWVTAAPLWPAAAREPARMRRPALLTFGSDDFMGELAAALAERRPDLSDALSRPEAHRARPAGAPADWRPPAGGLTLYQPVHGRFNLVAACLVCGRAGLPDHPPDAGAGEQAAFVLRRLGADGREVAWAADPEAPQERGWLPLAAGQAGLAEGEELLPLFPVVYGAAGRRRRLLAGLIPTASLETFRAAGALAPGHDPGEDARMVELEMRVLRPLAALRELGPVSPPEASHFVLLDLADLLALNLPEREFGALLAGIPSAAGKAVELYDLLETKLRPEEPTTWRDALRAAWDQRALITGDADGAPELDVDLGRSEGLPGLEEAFRSALPELGGAPAPSVETETPAETSVPKLDAAGADRYVVRCVYRRPMCGPLHPDLLSDPSEPFRIATFFDPDAPARTIRITLPVDTSIKDLRKFRRNVGFVISEQLRAQMSRVTDVRKALEGTLDEGESPGLGVVCSLSIPIITICALIVLMLFLVLLNLVFWWLPFFRICFPVPVRR